jgi:hypothetical protein
MDLASRTGTGSRATAVAALTLACLAVAPWIHPQAAGQGQPATAPRPEATSGGTAPPSKPASPADDEPSYQPPLRGAPGGRIGAGTRGGSDPGGAQEARESFMLVALAPDDAGLTITEQPALYWFASTWTTRELQFSISEVTETRPLVERRLPPPAQPGIQRIALADLGVRLFPGKRYQWFVALVTDPTARSKDIVAGAVIERVSMPPGLLPDQRRDPVALARAGLWYDAFDVLSKLAAANPGEPRLRTYRASLLEQVGLREVARWERDRSR